MKIALYQPWIYVKGGLEKSLLELISRSRHTWSIYTSHYKPQNTFSGFARHQVHELKRVTVNRDILSVLAASCTVMRQDIPLDGCDAFAVWCDGIGDLAVFKNNSLPTFCICSTPLRAAFDPVYMQQAFSKRGPLGRLGYKLFQTLFCMVDRRAWSRYDGVITTSAEVKKRIITGGLYREGPRMEMCYPGIDWHVMGGDVGYDPMLLVPGRIMWTKNIELAVEAFKKAALPKPWRLVVAGFLDRKSEEYYGKLQQLAGGSSQIEFVVSPDHEEMTMLYRRASAVLFPPLNEDWGIVPLEAMAHSKIVIATNSGGPAESVLDGETGFLLPPDAETWAGVLASLPGRTPELPDMGRRARAHVRRYDWSQFVSGIDDAFERWAALS